MIDISALGSKVATAVRPFLPTSVLINNSSVAGATVRDALNNLLAAIGSGGGGGGAVASVFGRTGAVVAALNDYRASLIQNNSGVAGANVKDALDNLLAAIPTVPPSPVTSVFGRLGAVIAAANDYAASQVANDSSVAGSSVKDALNALLANPPTVSSVFGRIGAIDAAPGDYAASDVGNDSAVSGQYVADALDTLLAAIDALAISIPSVPVTTVFGRIGNVLAAAGDYAASKITNDSSVAGAYVHDALNALLAAIPNVPVSSVHGRTGAVVSAADDYAASQVNNDSSVTGSKVSNALNTLLAAIAAIPPAPVSSVFSRAGAVVAAAGDYAASQVANDSIVDGATVAEALDALEGAIPDVETVFGRIGAVAAEAGDYLASQVENDSDVEGSDVKDALNFLKLQVDDIPPAPVSSVFGRTGIVIAVSGDYAASLINNDSSVAGSKVKDALDTLLAAIPVVPVQSVHGRTGIVIAQAGDYNATQVGLGNVTNDAQLKRAGNDYATFPLQSGTDPDDEFILERASDKAKYRVKKSSLPNASPGSATGNPWLDVPASTLWNDEFNSGSADLAIRGYTCLNGNTNAVMTRAGPFDPRTPTTSIPTNQYLSSIIGSELYVVSKDPMWILKATGGKPFTAMSRIRPGGRSDANYTNVGDECGLWLTQNNTAPGTGKRCVNGFSIGTGGVPARTFFGYYNGSTFTTSEFATGPIDGCGDVQVMLVSGAATPIVDPYIVTSGDGRIHRRRTAGITTESGFTPNYIGTASVTTSAAGGTVCGWTIIDYIRVLPYGWIT